MKVLITGGAGFVGRWFTTELLNRGHEVHVVDNLIDGGGGVEPGVNWFQGDPREFETFSWNLADCRSFFETDETEWDLVIHLAAVVGGRLVIERDPLAVSEDLDIDSKFWRWASSGRVAHVVHFSSSAAYPISLQAPDSHRPLAEGDLNFDEWIGVPDLTYGWAKLTSEFLAQLVHRQFGLSIANYRPFSGYGEDQDLSYPFPAIMKRVVEAEGQADTEFVVWGSGLQERDFIHIQDVVKIVLDTYPTMHSPEPLNLGTGIATNFISLAQQALQFVGAEKVVVGLSSMPEGVFSRVSDTSYSDSRGIGISIPLKEGIERVVTHMRSMYGTQSR